MPKKTKKERRHSAKALLALREEHNLSRRDLVERGISHHTVVAMECGRRIPDNETLMQLAAIYRMSVAKLRAALQPPQES